MSQRLILVFACVAIAVLAAYCCFGLVNMLVTAAVNEHYFPDPKRPHSDSALAGLIASQCTIAVIAALLGAWIFFRYDQ